MHADLTNWDLRNELTFADIGPRLNRWFHDMLGDRPTGVLVSHNTPVDIQYLLCEYIRTGIELPPQIRLGLDTCATLKRFASICYRKVPKDEWSILTKTGKNSMGVKPVAIYALSKRTPPEKFEETCGTHHDADADTKAVYVILFDQAQFGDKGLHGFAFKGNKKCFQPLEEIMSAMKKKMKEPVLEFEQTPPGWIPALSADPADPLSRSSHDLPAEVDEVKEKTYSPPPPQRGEGKPTPKLKRHVGANSSRTGTTMKATELMLRLFLFFFTMTTMENICKFTNAKATEVVWKLPYQRSDGSTHYKVSYPPTHEYSHLITWTHIALALQLEVSKTQVPGSFRGPRSKGWKPLTPGELYVWTGITLKMGTLGLPRCIISRTHARTHA